MKKIFFATASIAVWSVLSATTLPAFALGKIANISVIDRNTGQALPVHYHRGEYWVAGTPGNKYAIEINNKQPGRVLAVTSVDGVNVVTGQTASLAQSGYVFGALENYEITGWRKSDSAVAAFEFTASPKSYAEQTGRPRDVGVIGVALFKEKVTELSRDHSYSAPRHAPQRPSAQPSAESPSASAPPAPLAAPTSPPAQSARSNSATGAADSASAKESKAASPAGRSEALADQSVEKSANRSSAIAGAVSPPTPKLGTGHGERENSQVSRTTFERASDQPAEIIRIRYDNYSNLVAMGVIQPSRSSPSRPDPFPDSQAGYVPDPRR
jgi:hypothetical protein